MARAGKEAARSANRGVWTPILIVGGVAIVLLVLLVAVGGRLLAGSEKAAAPVLLTEGSAYRMYELRNDDALLTYTLQLQNKTGRALEGVTLRAILPQDAKSGFLKSENAAVRLQSGEETLDLPDGETRSFDVVLTAAYKKYGKTDRPSGELPRLYVVYPDGSEAAVETQ